jgi:Fe-S-cluster-containing hydrogenase component 2
VSLLDKKTVAMCDLCGGSPKCVEFCPKEALSLRTVEVGESARKKAVKKLLEEPSESSRQ